MQAKFVVLFVVAVSGLIVAIQVYDTHRLFGVIALIVALVAVAIGVLMRKDPHDQDRPPRKRKP